MDIYDHIHRVERHLSSRPGVVDVENPIAETLTSNRAIFKARIHFFDSSYLDILEIVDTNRCFPQYIKYKYQYTRQNSQVFRYDNSPFHSEIQTFPHHKHMGHGDDQNIIPSQRPNLKDLFHEIVQLIMKT